MADDLMNTDKKETPKLGEGVYLAIDVANILRLPYHKVRYAMNGFWHAHTFGKERNRAVNFYALIEFYTYYHLRDKKISAKKIKDFHKMLSKTLQTEYPFASVKISTQGQQIWYEHWDVLMKGDGKQQPVFRTFIEPFLKKIDFGADNLAERFYPLQRSKMVVVDPQHQFGQPTIKGTNIQTAAIYNLYKAGEKKETISELYDISLKQVKDAILYYKRA